MADRGLTLAEAQEILGIGKTKMYELVNSGELETFSVSGGTPRRVGEKGPRPSRRIRESDLERYIQRNRVPAP